MLGYAELVFVNVLSPKGTILGLLRLKSEFKDLLKAYKPTYFDGKKIEGIYCVLFNEPSRFNRDFYF